MNFLKALTRIQDHRDDNRGNSKLVVDLPEFRDGLSDQNGTALGRRSQGTNHEKRLTVNNPQRDSNPLRSLARGWWLILLTGLIALVVSLIPYDPVYRSDATLLVKTGREHLYQPELGDRAPIAGTRADLRSAINSEAKIITSTQVLRRAIKAVGAEIYLPKSDNQKDGNQPAGEPVETEILSISYLQNKLFGRNNTVIEKPGLELEAAATLAENLSVRFVDNTTVMEIQHLHINPNIAQQTLGAVLDTFMLRRQEIYGESSLPLMRSKLDQVTSELEVAEGALRDFNNQHQVSSVPDEINTVLSQKLETERRADLALLEQNSLEVQLDLFADQLANMDDMVPIYQDQQTNQVIAEARQLLFQKQQQEKELLQNYLPTSKAVTQIRSAIDGLKNTIASQNRLSTGSVRQGRNSVYDTVLSRRLEVQTKLAARRAEQISLTNLIEELENRISNLGQLEADQREKLARYNFLKSSQLSYMDEVQKADLAASLAEESAESIRIVEAASLPYGPQGLYGLKRNAFATLLGLLGSAALLLLFEILRRPPTPREPREIQGGFAAQKADEMWDGIYSAGYTPRPELKSIKNNPTYISRD